jgi:hypothetical protein
MKSQLATESKVLGIDGQAAIIPPTQFETKEFVTKSDSKYAEVVKLQKGFFLAEIPEGNLESSLELTPAIKSQMIQGYIKDGGELLVIKTAQYEGTTPILTPGDLVLLQDNARTQAIILDGRVDPVFLIRELDFACAIK